MPPDAHERCEGNTHVAVTRVLPYFHPKLITQWDSREDFISCLLTSCHIPWYLDGRCAGHFSQPKSSFCRCWGSWQRAQDDFGVSGHWT